MIEIKLNVDGQDSNFNIPEGWNEVTVDQASRLYSLDRENKNDLELMISIVNIFTGIDEEIIYMLTQEQFNILLNTIKFTNEEVKGELADSITIGEEQYFLKKDFNNLNMGEIISLETIIKQNEDNFPQAMAKLLCIFLRKKVMGNSGVEVLETFKNNMMLREEMFKSIIITDVNNIFLFFLTGNNILQNDMKESLENQNPKTKTKKIDTQI